MTSATNLLATNELKPFLSRFQEILSICEERQTLRRGRKDRDTQTICSTDDKQSPVPIIQTSSVEPIWPTDKPNHKLIGETISHYKILAKIGAGGMGVIYRAQDTRLRRQVAVKFASKQFQMSSGIRKHFQMEARAASAVNHPNICALYDIGEFAGSPFLVMELLKGRTLRKVIKVPLTLEAFFDLAIQIADALNALHTNGIMHEDIKPSNIFVNPIGWAKVFDFGLAEFSGALNGQDPGQLCRRWQSILTGEANALGTIPYMAPEQIFGEVLDTRVDLFSFGVVLYEMLTGRRPFQGTTSSAVVEAIIARPIVPVSALRPGLPDSLGKIVEKALEKDREYRCQSAAELRADLRRVQRGLRLEPPRRSAH
jgi:serine/threonine protein kinase